MIYLLKLSFVCRKTPFWWSHGLFLPVSRSSLMLSKFWERFLRWTLWALLAALLASAFKCTTSLSCARTRRSWRSNLGWGSLPGKTSKGRKQWMITRTHLTNFDKVYKWKCIMAQCCGVCHVCPHKIIRKVRKLMFPVLCAGGSPVTISMADICSISNIRPSNASSYHSYHFIQHLL